NRDGAAAGQVRSRCPRIAGLRCCRPAPPPKLPGIERGTDRRARLIVRRANYRKLLKNFSKASKRLWHEALVELDHELQDVVAIEEWLHPRFTDHANVTKSVRSLDCQAEPGFHGVKLCWTGAGVVVQPRELVSESCELFTAQARRVAPSPWACSDLDCRDDPIGIPKVSRMRMLTLRYLNRDV